MLRQNGNFSRCTKGIAMQIVLTADDLASFSEATRNEILRRMGDEMGRLPISAVPAAPPISEWYAGLTILNLTDITFKQVERWMERLSPTVARGMRIIAEQGPIFDAHWLTDAEINLKQFQSAVSKRTRAVTGDREAKLLVARDFDGTGVSPHGVYAVSPITHQSLRRYFGLPV